MMEDKFVEQQGTYMLSHSVGLPLKQPNQLQILAFGSLGAQVVKMSGTTGWLALNDSEQVSLRF